MNKIPFENGVLVTPAKVVIDGVEHKVIPAVYSGDTPFNKENLNQMQENIENAIDEQIEHRYIKKITTAVAKRRNNNYTMQV